MNNNSSKLGFLNIIVFVLSIYVLGALLANALFNLDPEIKKILDYADDMVCAIFLLDFSVRFYRAKNKTEFMKWGWIDLIASIPSIDYLRAGRLFSFIRILRIIRAFRSINQVISHLYANKARGVFSSVVVTTFLIYLACSIAILQVETAVNSNIRTAEDALWWAYTTLTTVGYGDHFPVTGPGRLIAMVLMTTGVGLGGTFAGFVASNFLVKEEPQKKPEPEEELV